MADTVIGSSIVIDGEISGDEALTIEGVVRGRIDVTNVLSVAKGAEVEAEIDCQAVELEGSVAGNVTAADKVDIKAGGRLVGDIKAPRVLIADGASFKGNINMAG